MDLTNVDVSLLSKYNPNDRVLAILGAIKKWDCIAQGIGVDKGGENCPLCCIHTICEDCPVMQKTGYHQCNYTPYRHIYIKKNMTISRWIKLQEESPYYIEHTLDYIEKEIEFLISLLLPKENYEKSN